MDTIETIVTGMLAQAKDYGLKEATIKYYMDVCHVIVRFINEKEGGLCSEKTLDAFVTLSNERSCNDEICKEYYRFQMRVIRMLKTFMETDVTDFSRRTAKKKYSPPPEMFPIIKEILDNYQLKNNARLEIDSVIRHFFCFIEEEGKSISAITDVDFFSFMEAVSETNKGSIGRTWRALRYISEYLQNNKLANLSSNLSMIKMRDTPLKLIAPYTQEEIKKIVDSIDLSSAIGIRNKAIILLGFQTGLRASDIINLKLSDIDWKAGLLHIKQSKTGKDLLLPLNGIVMNAVADYILEVRPVCCYDEIFITSKAPIHPFQNSVSLTNALDKYCSNSGVKKIPSRGFHSLRRTFATEMSLAGVDLTIISQMLGHKSIDEDKPYLSYDIQKNAFCSIGFNGVPIKYGIYAHKEGGANA